jgi:integrase
LHPRARKGATVAPTPETFEPFALAWLEATRGQLSERTAVEYKGALDVQLIPILGAKRLSAIDVDTVAATIAKLNRKGLAPWTVKRILTPLSRILNSAARRGLIGENPMRRLERGERPKVERREQRILRGDEIATFLTAAPPRYRTLLATALSTGLREMELLGLTWADVDFDRGVMTVRAQLSRITGERKPLKTGAAKREVPLTASIARELKLHRIASPFKAPADFVFATGTGRPMGMVQRDPPRATQGR